MRFKISCHCLTYISQVLADMSQNRMTSPINVIVKSRKCLGKTIYPEIGFKFLS